MSSNSTINRTETITTGEVLMDAEAIQVYGPNSVAIASWQK